MTIVKMKHKILTNQLVADANEIEFEIEGTEELEANNYVSKNIRASTHPLSLKNILIKKTRKHWRKRI